MINCLRILPITFRIPISLSLLDEIAIAVFVKLKQAIKRIKIPITIEPIMADEGGATHVEAST